MTTMTVTAKSQVTLKKDLLRHLGIEPGQKIEAIELPGGRIEVRAARASRSIDDFIGLLAEKTGKVASLSELQEAAANSWAGRS
jgi:bifunctional DNA-binding transcriptional regulator/antitoxin component of YhaV-PrlF toxin-antitoxin module